MTRKLLILSYHFPPSNEVAGKPTARLVRHLPSNGWEPTVVSVDPRQVPKLDLVGYREVLEGTQVEQPRRWLHPFDLLRKVKRFSQAKKSAQEPHQITASNGEEKQRGRLRSRMRELLGYPDYYSGWIMPAFGRASHLLRSARFDAYMTISPPVSAHLVGLMLRKRFRRIPWFVQFHDPWSNNPFNQWGLQFLSRLDTSLESLVIRNATRVFCATEEATAALAMTYPQAEGFKFATLYNGADSSDFPVIPSDWRNDRLTFTYAGCLYGTRNPFPFLESIARLIERKEIAPKECLIRLIGDCEFACGKSVRQFVQSNGLDEVVEFSPPITYPAALEALMKSDILLLFADQQPNQIPAKLFEYLLMRRPILGFTSGASARLIRQAAAGHVCESIAPEELDRILLSYVGQSRSGERITCDGSSASLERFEAGHLARELAQALNATLQVQHDRKHFEAAG